MRKLLFAFFIGCSALLPVAQIQAQSTELPAPTFEGGLAPGTKFTVKIIKVQAIKVDSKGRRSKTSIPKGIPVFKKGQKLNLEIGSNEQLKGPGFTFRFVESAEDLDSGNLVNAYEKPTNLPQPNGASLLRSPDGRILRAGFGFYKWSLRGSNPSAIVVVYTANDSAYFWINSKNAFAVRASPLAVGWLPSSANKSLPFPARIAFSQASPTGTTAILPESLAASR
ncbi:MAG: hypothetical protein HC767_07530 [Akkermansiaceae bacterium]|nr:hypothetical protein [Akkermansiaceae bacterium]